MLPHCHTPPYPAIIPSSSTPTSGPWRARVRSLCTPAAHHSRSTERNADGRRVHFRMRLGASSRRRKRAPSRSSSTIATAAAASAGHSRFFTSAYYIHRRRQYTHAHLYVHTCGKTRSTVDGNLAFYLHYARAVHIYIYDICIYNIYDVFSNIVPTITLQVVPNPCPIKYILYGIKMNFRLLLMCRLRFKNKCRPTVYTVRVYGISL
uniref:Uncharacterized protein n=1 Tax=Schizaphis graminum TaxID=13262 RepID=A0A2S2NIP6_SCHGA